jgi:hypothetical protein
MKFIYILSYYEFAMQNFQSNTIVWADVPFQSFEVSSNIDYEDHCPECNPDEELKEVMCINEEWILDDIRSFLDERKETLLAKIHELKNSEEEQRHIVIYELVSLVFKVIKLKNSKNLFMTLQDEDVWNFLNDISKR